MLHLSVKFYCVADCIRAGHEAGVVHEAAEGLPAQLPSERASCTGSSGCMGLGTSRGCRWPSQDALSGDRGHAVFDCHRLFAGRSVPALSSPRPHRIGQMLTALRTTGRKLYC